MYIYILDLANGGMKLMKRYTCLQMHVRVQPFKFKANKSKCKKE